MGDRRSRDGSVTAIDVMDERHAHHVLGLGRPATREQVTRAYRKTAKRLHPDAGGDHAEFLELERAYRAALAAAVPATHLSYLSYLSAVPDPGADADADRNHEPAPRPVAQRVAAPARRQAEPFAVVFERQLRRHSLTLV